MTYGRIVIIEANCIDKHIESAYIQIHLCNSSNASANTEISRKRLVELVNRGFNILVRQGWKEIPVIPTYIGKEMFLKTEFDNEPYDNLGHLSPITDRRDLLNFENIREWAKFYNVTF
jgi:hypothetical protein